VENSIAQITRKAGELLEEHFPPVWEVSGPFV